MSECLSKFQTQYDLIIIGGGPAGLSAALSARANGIEKILICERDESLGGILNQCIHHGFGLHYFGEELTGPDYASRFIEKVEEAGIDYLCETMVVALDRLQYHLAQQGLASEEERAEHKLSEEEESLLDQGYHLVHFVSPQGAKTLVCKAVILAMGCRERSASAIALPGTRPSGVLTAGAAQYYCNIEGYLTGKRVVILGSGDIGLIMARRMVWEGADVLACVERQPWSNGLQRNITQCLEDYNIPLYLSHTVTKIIGRDHLEAIEISKLDENFQPIEGSTQRIDCDCLLVSVGLIPENDLVRSINLHLDSKTKGAFVDQYRSSSVSGVFSCGNVLHVHDLVDFVSEEAQIAGAAAARYIKSEYSRAKEHLLMMQVSGGISYVLPQCFRLNLEAMEDFKESKETVTFFFRTKKPEKKQELRLFLVYQDMDNSKKVLVKRQVKQHLIPSEMERFPCVYKAIYKALTTLSTDVLGKSFDDLTQPQQLDFLQNTSFLLALDPIEK